MRKQPPPDFRPETLNNYYWHQAWNIFPNMATPGRVPVGVVLERVGIPERLDGKRVLDVGAWNGCTSLECERRGAAEVVALSLEDPDQSGFNWLKSVVDAHKTSYVRGSIYNLDPQELGTFDIVLCLGVLYHLRYPVLGIDNLRRVTKGDLFIETHALDNALLSLDDANEKTELSSELRGCALLQFYKSNELASDASNWFAISTSALTGMLETAGFTVDNTSLHGERSYARAHVNAGFPPFLANNTYEGQLFYDHSLRRLFGPRERWERLLRSGPDA